MNDNIELPDVTDGTLPSAEESLAEEKSLAEESLNEGIPPTEIPGKSAFNLDLIDSSENGIRFGAQIHNFPSDIINKKIINKIEEHMKNREFNFYGQKTILTEKIDSSSIFRYLMNIGSLFVVSGKTICMSDEFICELEYSTRSTYTSLYFGIFTTSLKTLENTKELLVKTFKDIIKDVMSCNILWFYTDFRGMIKRDCVSEVLDDIIFQESYPFIENLNEFISQYESSDEKVLIMMGPPGTGKTRLVRYILRQIGKVCHNIEDNEFSLYYTTDSQVLKKDEMFISFITSRHRIMVLEDIDFSLRSRTDGNKEMYRLLATSDGLFQNMNKKMIISTNISCNDDIDPALIRPGRCFGVIEFRALTAKEGNLFLETIGSEERVTRTHTLAELYKIYNSDKEPLVRNIPTRRIPGF